MSESGPICPRCGQWTSPTDLRDDPADHSSRIVGACWKCPCGFMWTEYEPRYLEELEAQERADEARQRAEAEEYDRTHPYRYDVFVQLDEFYRMVARTDSREEAVSVAQGYGGRRFMIWRRYFDRYYQEWLNDRLETEGTA